MHKITMRSITFYALAFINLAGCSNVVEHKTLVYQGENLITPYSGFLAGWQMSVENKENYKVRMWQHPIDGFKNAYVISVTLPINKLADIRQVIDEPGYESCEKFTTFTLQSSPNKLYPSEMWQTNCSKKDGSKAEILHLILQGQDSFYHVQKIWQGNINAKEIKQWQNRFKQIYLCDSRITKVICPNN